jgi:hypothetical protein
LWYSLVFSRGSCNAPILKSGDCVNKNMVTLHRKKREAGNGSYNGNCSNRGTD